MKYVLMMITALILVGCNSEPTHTNCNYTEEMRQSQVKLEKEQSRLITQMADKINGQQVTIEKLGNIIIEEYEKMNKKVNDLHTVIELQSQAMDKVKKLTEINEGMIKQLIKERR